MCLCLNHFKARYQTVQIIQRPGTRRNYSNQPPELFIPPVLPLQQKPQRSHDRMSFLHLSSASRPLCYLPNVVLPDISWFLPLGSVSKINFDPLLLFSVFSYGHARLAGSQKNRKQQATHSLFQALDFTFLSPDTFTFERGTIALAHRVARNDLAHGRHLTQSLAHRQ